MIKLWSPYILYFISNSEITFYFLPQNSCRSQVSIHCYRFCCRCPFLAISSISSSVVTIDARRIRGNNISHALELEILQWRVRGMYFDIWRSISFDKEWEKEEKTRKRKKRLKLQTRRGHSTARVLSTKAEAALAQLLPALNDPFQELNRTRWIPCAGDLRPTVQLLLARDLISLSLPRSLVEHPNGATDQGLVAAWRLAPRVVGIPKFRAFILFPW